MFHSIVSPIRLTSSDRGGSSFRGVETLSQLHVVYLVVMAIGTGVTLLLFSLYRQGSVDSGRGALRSLLRPLEFTPEQLGGFSYYRLVVVSLLTLFVELLVIRWVSSEIRIFAYLKNYVLIACFLGFGLGCYLCRRPIHLAPVLLPLLFIAPLVKISTPWMRNLIDSLSAFLGETSEVNFWGIPQLPHGPSAWLRLGAAVLFTLMLFSMISLVFIPFGQMVGWHLEKARRGIFAYSLNVLASLGGILLYTLLCFWAQPPWVWFAVAGVLLVLLFRPRRILMLSGVVAFALVAALTSLSEGKDAQIHWSPYQKLMLMHDREDGKVLRYHLLTNNTWYQQIVNLSPEFVDARPDLFEEVPARYNAYNVPYHFYPDPPSVLVLGAGMGNDAAAALRNNAGAVVAVEIDPTIVQLGRDLHFERPYSSPRVEVVVDDARSYIQNTDRRFDLIVFSLLDSHTTSSHYSNIRIDNYVYTVEAMEAAKRLLAPDGVFIVKFQVSTPWIAERLYGLFTEAFNRKPIQLETVHTPQTSHGRFFITGPDERLAGPMQDQEFLKYAMPVDEAELQPTTLTTDNWPYFYQHAPGLPACVIVISLLLVALSWIEIRTIGGGLPSINRHFFFLGAGFLLLQTQIISKMALLFGTTWVVNSFVIGCLLLLVVVANMVVARWPAFPTGLAYAGIFASMLLTYLIPTRALFFESEVAKGCVATALYCLPIFFASVVFIQSFARAGFAGLALGSNLFGAMVGGLLESLSLWTGMRSLLIVAALLYLASWLALRRERSGVRRETADSLIAASG